MSDHFSIDTANKKVSLSQSLLNSFMMCPEQARQELFGLTTRTESDATVVGSAVHLAIESFHDHGDPKLAAKHASDYMDEQVAKPTFVWAKAKDLREMRTQFVTCFSTWLDKILPSLPDHLHLEHRFKLPWAQINGWEVQLQGQIDMVCTQGGLLDWKTASSPYQKWEVDRYAIQPTAYTWAVDQLLRSGNWADLPPRKVYRFDYVVMDKTKPEFQFITVQRRPPDWRWLGEIISTFVGMLESGLNRWPLSPNGWHCSPRWCPAWQNCRGRIHGDDPWKQLRGS